MILYVEEFKDVDDFNKFSSSILLNERAMVKPITVETYPEYIRVYFIKTLTY